MTKEELIDRLAEIHRARQWNTPQLDPWEKIQEGTKDIWRAEVRRSFLPIIIEYVAGWLDKTADIDTDMLSSYMWRKEFE